ncbi:hypothetical protein Patl1_05806 [Pistacia atlantica]|uniref:Uncharacterized protein n=1 Tax=Pistacia atlantica TaxID=434234 RepID=A0ACC1BUF5_9ROSI|nr:hypothetical protein Patl1_05806 [Pistacia atlantica]
MLQILGNLGMSLFSTSAKGSASAPHALGFQKYVHSTSQKDFENGRNSRPMDFVRDSRPTDFVRDSRPMDFGRDSRPMNFGRDSRPMNFGRDSRPMDFVRDSRPMDFGRDSRPMNFGRDSRPMDFVRGVIEEDGSGFRRQSQYPRYSVEQNADVVHMKFLFNNTFVTVTDSKGNKKMGASWGCLPELKGAVRMSRYAPDATAEHVGRLAKNMGLKSFVMKVNGFTYFRKKKQAILSFREGFGNSRNQSPIVYIEDTTRKPHNGCRLRKQRRI